LHDGCARCCTDRCSRTRRVMRCNMLCRVATCCAALQHAEPRCNMQCRVATCCAALQHAVPRCNMLCRVATCCAAFQHAVPCYNMQCRVSTCCALCQIKMQLRKKKYVFTTADATVQRLQKAYWKQVSACVCAHSLTVGSLMRVLYTASTVCVHSAAPNQRVRASTCEYHESPRGCTHESERTVPCTALRGATAVPYRCE
jgi:hypothetical protein